MAKFYADARWRPRLILLQIICMQSAFYMTKGLVLLFCHGSSLSLDQFFAYYTQSFASIDGIKNAVAVFISSIACAVYLVFLVERAKKCLDFGVTLYFIDLLVQTFYSEFPKSWDWWLIHIASAATTILLGEYLCARRELEDIPMLHLFQRS